ncbi:MULTISPECIES: hypothetical protein [unclassified Roseateles]|uniref:hypothetical protein n=1 Tax=unclassified Roseateles TaxID=2626991 RepID=UPI000733A6F4|nr:hypothetical protein [Paucibacter sp. KCTC 42545]ALT78908.1 hypothetical protein AT984_18650 [Paucibacter sp. KCTC 42545]
MNTQDQTPVATISNTDVGPVEISLDLLQQVSGGTPRGGWIVEPTTVLAIEAEAPTPRGGW